MAKHLVISFEGNSMKILNEFNTDIRKNFHKMAYSLNQRFNPKERVEALKIEFKNRKRNRNESIDTYARELKKLAGKAYGNLSTTAQNVWVLDQFLSGLNS